MKQEGLISENDRLERAAEYSAESLKRFQKVTEIENLGSGYPEKETSVFYQ